VHGCYIVVIGGKQRQSVSLEIIVVCRGCAYCTVPGVLCAQSLLWPIKQYLLAVKTGKHL
jgi:hypothetical protein